MYKVFLINDNACTSPGLIPTFLTGGLALCRFLFDGVKVAEFAIPEDVGRAGRIALGIILTILFAALIAGLAAYAYHRFCFISYFQPMVSKK